MSNVSGDCHIIGTQLQRHTGMTSLAHGSDSYFGDALSLEVERAEIFRASGRPGLTMTGFGPGFGLSGRNVG